MDADGNTSSAEGTELINRRRGAGTGLTELPTQHEARTPLSARTEREAPLEAETIGRSRAGSAPPAARAQGERQMPAPVPQQLDYASPEETQPATHAGIMLQGAAQALEEEELIDEYIFRLRTLFEPDVKSLEFQVNWQDDMLPAVGLVKEAGEADRRGILQGDSIAVINGMPTEGKVRADLLPLLKERPLTLEVRRCHRVADPRNPYLQLHFVLGGSGGNHGFKVARASQLPVVASVEAGSPAAQAGILEGDFLAQLGGYDAQGMQDGALRAALQEQPLNLVVMRPPLGHEAGGVPLEEHILATGRYPRESWDSDED